MNISKTKAWRIEQIPYDELSKYLSYSRVYGWGWLGPIGATMVVTGAIGLITHFKIAEELLVGSVFTGFILLFAGAILNGFSERKSMSIVNAKCLDVQVKYTASSMKRSANWAVRALCEYKYNEEVYLSTPMPYGIAYFLNQESAKIFSTYLIKASSIKLYIDPKRPKRSLFYNLNAGKNETIEHH